jgi:N-acetylglucosamine-6-phosphate deacetylase
MRAIVGGTIYTPDESIEGGVVVLDGRQIQAVGRRDSTAIPAGCEVIDATGLHVAPGYIDVHVHGLLGYDAMGATLAEVIRRLPRFGVTSFLATTLTVPEETLYPALVEMAKVLANPPAGAHCLGIHVEGPHLSPKWPGMAIAEWFKPLSREEFARLQEAAGGHIKLITFAPEEGEAMSAISYLVESGVVASVGHSDATLEQVQEAVRLGLSHATHTYNAMRPLRHRDPGVVGAVMQSNAIWAELIADGIHVHPAAMEILLRVKGPERVVLVSDGAPLAGLPDDHYRWHDQEIVVKEGSCRLPSGTLAGAHSLLDSSVRNMVNLVGLAAPQAIKLATANVAAAMNFAGKGRLQAGYDADLVLLDGDLRPAATFVGGEVVMSREP